jgi:ethylbenzene dioxygenase beta subunit
MTKDQLLALDAAGSPVDMATFFEIQNSVNKEVYLLNHEKLDQWCERLEDDLIYWAPLRENILRRNRVPEISTFKVPLFEETKDSILMRLKRNDSGMCWTEDPPTRQVTAISNLQAFKTDKDDEFEVHTVFTLYRSRFERDDNTLMGRRKDIWRKVGNDFRLAGRLIMLQQSTLLTKNLNVFM